MTDHPETAGLLALMLLHHARRPARTRPDGTLVPLAEQDRSLWDTTMIALPRYEAVAAHLHEMAGDRSRAADLYAAAADRATSIPERDHLTRQSARLRRTI